jgi:predicted transposase YbfD/YdcC
MELKETLDKVADFRVQGRCLHGLADILGLVLCGVIADCDDFDEIADYGNDNREFLQQAIGLSFPNGIPSADTLNRVVRYLDSHSMEACFKACIAAFPLAGKQICIDGKELRGTIPAGKKHALVRMVNVWVEEYSVSFGQLAVEEKSNEIMAIPVLLDTIDCKGSIVSIDAIGCQQEIVEKIRDKQAHYVIALKANQGGLYEQVADFMQRNKPSLAVDQQLDKAHGRGEERRVYIAQAIDLVEEKDKWRDLHTLIMVERKRIIAGKQQAQTMFYISSLTDPDPVLYSCYVRGHWAIENGLHWQLDVTFGEDEAKLRKDKGPTNLHLIRKWALHLLKNEPSSISIKRKRKKANRDTNFLLAILND